MFESMEQFRVQLKFEIKKLEINVLLTFCGNEILHSILLS